MTMDERYFIDSDGMGNVDAVFKAVFEDGRIVFEYVWNKNSNLWQPTRAVSYYWFEGDVRMDEVSADFASRYLPAVAIDKSVLVKYSDDQPRDENGRFGSGGGGSTNGSATNPKIDAVANKVQEKTQSLISQGATFDRMMNAEQQRSDYEQLLALGATVDPEMSPEEGISMETGWEMTAEAINYGNADQTLSADEGNVYAMHDSAGQLAGAIAYSIVNDGNNEVVEIHYLGTTGAVDGAGSALFGNAASWAADRGLGLALTWLDTDAQSFWQNMGFDKREDEQNPRLLFMSPNDTAQIAGGING